MKYVLDKFVEVLSLFLTSPTLVFGLGVVCLWGPKALEALRVPSFCRTDTQWLILGIVLGFLGSVVDNLYWGFAWSFYFVESPWAEWWFHHGAYSNVVFRQTAGTLAAYCHLRAFYGGRELPAGFTWAWVLWGTVYVFVLAWSVEPLGQL